MRCLRCDEEYDDALDQCPYCDEYNSAKLPPVQSDRAVFLKQLKRERRIYLLLALLPMLIGLPAIILLFTVGNTETSFGGASTLAVLVVFAMYASFMYGTFRLGNFLHFDRDQWVIAILLSVICAYWPSIIYMIYEASKADPAEPKPYQFRSSRCSQCGKRVKAGEVSCSSCGAVI